MLGCEPLPYIDNDGSEVWYGGKHYRVTDAPGLDVIRMELRETFGVTRYLVPVLTDPATLGCLLHLVREAWGCHVYTYAHGESVSAIVDGENVAHFREESEAAVLVAALEGAP